MKKIAVYGKGGIGKSTVCANAAAAMARMGLKVLQIGCDPKADSTLVHGGDKKPTVLDALRAGGFAGLEDVARTGEDGVVCVECGGPIPGTGCAGRGIVTAFDFLRKQRILGVYRPDAVLYDVLGDVVCGGFAMPMRGEYARNVFIVTSGEKMSLYAAENIALALEHFRGRGYARLTGLILNRRGVKNEYEAVQALAGRHGVPVAADLARDPAVEEAAEKEKTVFAAFPGSETAARYETLARALLALSDETEPAEEQ